MPELCVNAPPELVQSPLTYIFPELAVKAPALNKKLPFKSKALVPEVKVPPDWVIPVRVNVGPALWVMMPV